MIVLDASVAAKWFVDESSSEIAKEILLQIQKSPDEFIVPELFYVEMLSVLSRLVSSAPLLQEYITMLEDLGLTRVGHGHELLFRAAELTKEFTISAYDALYAATAELSSAVWLTADEKAHRQLKRLGISKLL